MNEAYIDILSLGSLHDAVLEFSQQKSIDSFWGSVALNARWVVPSRRVCVLTRCSESSLVAIARVEHGKQLDPLPESFNDGRDALGRAINADAPIWIEDVSDISTGDTFRKWLRMNDSNVLHVVPLVGSSGRLGSLLFELCNPSDQIERSRLTALASLYARHAASAHAVIKSSVELATKNQQLEQTRQELEVAADEIRSLNTTLEQRIEDRTRELQQTERELVKAADEIREFNSTLEQRIEDRTRELEQTQQELIEVSRQAGMAEVASAVLHNVGNALSSINMASLRIGKTLQNSLGNRLAPLVKLLHEHEDDLSHFLHEDKRGQNVIPYLEQLVSRVNEEQQASLEESRTIREGIDHIKAIVTTQQSYAGNVGIVQQIDPVRLVEDALKMSQSGLSVLGIDVSYEFDELGKISIDRHKVIQILLNLISNAKHALEAVKTPRRLTLRVSNDASGNVLICVEDNGVGITQESGRHLFTHGFTTKEHGHGFGLHHSALTAKQLGGELSFTSAGPGKGAAFTLILPDLHISSGVPLARRGAAISDPSRSARSDTTCLADLAHTEPPTSGARSNHAALIGAIS